MSSSNAKKRSNLKKLLNRSSENEEEESDKSTSSNASKKSTSSSVGSQRAKQSKKTTTQTKQRKEKDENEQLKKSSSVLLIPDTCFYGSSDFENFKGKQAPSKIKPSSRVTVIRDTIDSNDEILEPFESEKKQDATNKMNNLRDENLTCIDIDQTYVQVPDTMADHLENKFRLASKLDHLVQNDKHSSTPLAVKRQLQEHGLLDMTNSPARTQTEAQTSSSCEPSPINKIPPNVPVAQASSSNLGNQRKSQTAKTPVKVIRIFRIITIKIKWNFGTIISNKWRKLI